MGKQKKDKEGKCPKCGASLTYDGVREMVDKEVYYPVVCLKCGFEGNEWYELRFVEICENLKEAAPKRTV